jgi:hypothetical protein
MLRKQIPNLSPAMIKDAEIRIEQNYGLANVELSALTTSDTVYEIAGQR